MKKKILLVEDELALRLLVEEELLEEGYEVFTARDGREAIQRFEEGIMDLGKTSFFLQLSDHHFNSSVKRFCNLVLGIYKGP